MVEFRVGIDLDGVCSPFEEDLRHFAVEHLGYPEHEVSRGGADDEDTKWDFPVHMWGWTPEQFVEACNAAVDAGVLHLHSDPYPGVVEMFNELRGSGYSIHIVTARNFGTRSAHNTADWLREHDLDYDGLHFLKEKWVVGTDIHLDDSPATFLSMIDHGSDVYLLDRPWNRHVDARDRRVKTYADFVRIARYTKAHKEFLVANLLRGTA